jgi:hypothetical protein
MQKRMFLVVGTVLAAVALLAPLAAQASPPAGRITPTSIGGLTLGLRTPDYVRLAHEKAFTTRYANGTRRLLFAKAEITVLLDRQGRGVRITTAAEEYTFAGGGGPCSRFDSYARKHRFKTYATKTAFGPGAVVYRTGRLWLTLSDTTHLGSVTLASGTPPLQALLGAAQCGVGDEQGE